MAKAKILEDLIGALGLNVLRFEDEIGVKRSRLSKAIERDSTIQPEIADKITTRFPNVNRDWLVTGKGSMFTDTETPATQSNEVDMSDYIDLGTDKPRRISSGMSAVQTEGDKLRLNKAIGDKEDEGLIVVPIRAQAGYSKLIIDPVHFKDFGRMQIPDMPYKGDRYRVFEVEGSSMEPTLKQFYLVITERVDPEDWNQTANYYIYVIVTEDRVMIKRLYNKDKDKFVAMSDNNQFYPQFFIQKKDIKELWLVKRKVDWEMPPPMKFDIEI